MVSCSHFWEFFIVICVWKSGAEKIGTTANSESVTLFFFFISSLPSITFAIYHTSLLHAIIQIKLL